VAKDKTAFSWLFEKSKKELWKILLLSLLGMAMSYLSVRFAFASKAAIDVATGVVDVPLSQPVIALALLMISQIVIHIVYTVVDHGRMGTGELLDGGLEPGAADGERQVEVLVGYPAEADRLHVGNDGFFAYGLLYTLQGQDGRDVQGQRNGVHDGHIT